MFFSRSFISFCLLNSGPSTQANLLIFMNKISLVGLMLLYWWPTDGWQRGTVACLCPCGAFSYVVDYRDTRQTSALCGTDTLLDAASYGSRWVTVLLSPVPAGGITLRPRVRGPPALGLSLGLDCALASTGQGR